MQTSTDRIERRILLRAPLARVWRAVSDSTEFGAWFGVDFKGKPFAAGEPIWGQVTYPGFEHHKMEIWIDRIEPERLLSWRWHPAAIDLDVDYSNEPMTLVSFELAEAEGGVVLTVVESGLDQIPAGRRPTVMRLNNSGWDEQMQNIEKHVAAA